MSDSLKLVIINRNCLTSRHCLQYLKVQSLNELWTKALFFNFYVFIIILFCNNLHMVCSACIDQKHGRDYVHCLRYSENTLQKEAVHREVCAAWIPEKILCFVPEALYPENINEILYVWDAFSMHIINPLIQSTYPMSLIRINVLNALRNCVGLKHLTVVCEMALVQVPLLAASGVGEALLQRFSNQFFVFHLLKLRKKLV